GYAVRGETVLAQAEPDDAALADLAEGEAAGEIIAEGDTDYPAEEAVIEEEVAAPAAPSLAEAPAADGDEHDRIASLIASSVSEGGQAGEDREVNAPQAEEPSAASGGVFRDCGACPEMATIPAGSFVMGSPAGEPARQPQEGPQVEVTIPRPFALGAKEVTFEQWDACVADGACAAHAPYDAGWGRGARPVVNVSWEDAQAYAEWLSEKTGHTYRLPSEEEWEYAARAGAVTPFADGAFISTDQANFDGGHPYGGEAGDIRGRTTPVGAFAANPFGLYDMNGNVWEWVADCWSASHDNAPADGAARGGDCSSRVLKGGAWNTGGWRLRAGHRIGKSETAREYDNGFRVARDLG
ncbi:MAG: formylglycine-generating enzyme family protein, partial [Amphiplicatus sp.]